MLGIMWIASFYDHIENPSKKPLVHNYQLVYTKAKKKKKERKKEREES